VVVSFLVPFVIPGVGVDFTYFFIIGLVLFAWFTIKWHAVTSLERRGNLWEILLGLAAIVALYAYKTAMQERLGILDMTLLFCATVVAFYGFRSFKLFWVPAVYGAVLLLGYQIEAATPNYVALQDWMANVMASMMSALGVSTFVSGHLVILGAGSNQLGLDVESDCTGIQGILAFGLLSTMALLDVKPKLSRLIPIFALGFLGAFLINIVRLFMVFVTFEYFGVEAGTEMHVYLGYSLFVGWVLLFWSLAFRYLAAPVSGAGGAVSAGGSFIRKKIQN